LNALDVESSRVIDLEKFVPRGDLDPVYFDLYPDCSIAVETLRMIGTAMAEAGVVGQGRLTLSRHERNGRRRAGRRSSASPKASSTPR
jgi:DNA end-binding protein Ku